MLDALVLDQIELGRRARLHQRRGDVAFLLSQSERAGERFIARLQFGDVLLSWNAFVRRVNLRIAIRILRFCRST